jgi:flagellar hook-associated protein 2
VGDEYISRASNSVTDVIDGVTMLLKSSGAGTITVETDIDAVVENVQSFVDQVNEVRSAISALTKYDSTTETASLLTGNYGVQMIDSVMKNITAATGLGFDYKRDTYSSLSPLGLTTDADEGSDTFGQILLEEDTLRTVLSSNAYAAGRIFAAQYLGDTNSADISYTSFVDGITKAGEYTVNYTVSGGKLSAATIDGHPVIFSSNSSTLTGNYGYAEGGMVLTVNNLTDGTYSHNVNVRLGKASELVDELGDLTNSETGPLAILEDNYSTIQENIQEKIDNENVRIATLATHLKDKFSRLDTLLGTYSDIQDSLSSYITQLTSD